VDLNGKQLELGPDDAPTVLAGANVRGKKMTLAPKSIVFIAFPKADNASCK
jgi:hypothetical protein